MATFDEIRQRISKPMKGYVDKMLKENQNFLNKGKNFVNPSSSNVSTSPYKTPKRKIPKRVGPVVNDYLGESSPWIEDKKDREYVSPYMERFKDTDWQPKKVEKELPEETGYGVDYGMGTDLPFTEQVVDYTGKKIVLASATTKGLQEQKLKFLNEDRKFKNKAIKEERERLEEETFEANVETYMKVNKWSKDRAVEVAGYSKKSYHELLQLQTKYLKYFKKDDDENYKYSDETRNIFEKKLDDLQGFIDSAEDKEEENYLTPNVKMDSTPDFKQVDNQIPGLTPGGAKVERVPYLEEDPKNYFTSQGGSYITYKGAWYSKDSWEKKKRELETSYNETSLKHKMLYEENFADRPGEAKFVSGVYDGEYYVFPTVFKREGEDVFIELSKDEAFNEALIRGEAIPFDSEWEANLFSRGSWRKYDE